MEGFNDRVSKLFDCLSSSSSSSPAWSLSDAQIQRHTWNRNKDKGNNILNDDETLVSSSFNNLFNKKNKHTNSSFDDNDDTEEEDEREEHKVIEDGDDLDVGSSIGLDPTLDFEDEEDEYDKIATGTEDTSPHLLYMKDVTHHAKFLNSHTVLSNEGSDGVKVRSILKRKSDEEMEKPNGKRVRFDPGCKERDASKKVGFRVPRVVNNNRGNVPDYVMNPRRYTKYSFKEEEDKKSNTEAYMDFLAQIRKSKSKDIGSEENVTNQVPSSVVFIPRKKRGDEMEVKETSTGVGVGIGIAAVEVQQEEVCEMVQDEAEVDVAKFQKPSRRYRSKVEDDDSVC